jgi:hypothetical protein
MKRHSQSIGFVPKVKKKLDELVLEDAYETIILKNELLEHKGKRSHDGNHTLLLNCRIHERFIRDCFGRIVT